jgi:hypothetical protein
MIAFADATVLLADTPACGPPSAIVSAAAAVIRPEPDPTDD